MLESTRSQDINDICRRLAKRSAARGWSTTKSVAAVVSACSVGAAAPQLSQYLLLQAILLPHLAHSSARGVPQPAQNLACLRFSDPHTEHGMPYLPVGAKGVSPRGPTHRRRFFDRSLSSGSCRLQLRTRQRRPQSLVCCCRWQHAWYFRPAPLTDKNWFCRPRV